MSTTHSTVVFNRDISLDFRALSLQEIAEIIRDFRDDLAPMVAQATELSLSRRTTTGSQDTVQQAFRCSAAILDRVLVTASGGVVEPASMQALPLPAKIEALGVVIRRTLEAHPIDRIITCMAIAAITTVGSSAAPQWVAPASAASALN